MNWLLLISSLVLASSAIGCDYLAQFSRLERNEISLVEFMKFYNDCFGIKSEFGFQPSCSATSAATQAVAKFHNKGKLVTSANTTVEYELKGVVSFQQTNNQLTKIYGVFKGVQAFQADSPLFALHVHQKGELNPSCMATAAHFNPCNKTHSDDPRVAERHIGDVANVTMQAGSDILVIESVDPQVKLSGPLSVLGRSIVVHAGAKGSRVGCAIIGVTDWPKGDRHPDTFYDPSNPTEFWKN